MEFIWSKHNKITIMRYGSSICGLTYKGERPDYVMYTEQEMDSMPKYRQGKYNHTLIQALKK